MKLAISALISFAVTAAGSAAGQQATPTPIEEHVVAPSLPDQPNKEGVVRPSGSMPTDSEGYVRTNRGAVDPSSTSPAPGGAAAQGSATGSGAARGTAKAPTFSSPPISASPAAGSAHAKAGVVSPKPVAVSHGAASTVTSYQKGKSLTVKTPAGSLVEYRLGKGTILPDDLGPGRQVLVETKIVKKHRVATKVSYAEGRVVLTNVN